MLETLLGHVPISFHIFMLFASLTVVGAVGVAFSGNIVYSAFALLASFAGVVGLFAFMSADFLAMVQLMVYIGGILVLILFAVMLTNRIEEVKNSNPSSNVPMGIVLFLSIAALLVGSVGGYDWPTREPEAFAAQAPIIGEALLGPYLISFEIAGIVLLAALVAAVVVARKEVREEDEPLAKAQAAKAAQGSAR